MYINLEPKQKKERTFEAIRDLLVRGSQENTSCFGNGRSSLDRQDHGGVPELHDQAGCRGPESYSFFSTGPNTHISGEANPITA